MATTIIEKLREDHKELLQCMEALSTAITVGDNAYDSLFKDFKAIFHKHDQAEDKIFYPAIRKYPQLDKLILKGYQAHHMVEVGLLELRLLPYTSESWGPKFLVIRDSILSHMNEEEEEIFPKAFELLTTQENEELAAQVAKQRAA